MKPTKLRNRKAQDATLIQVNALKKKLAALVVRVKRLEDNRVKSLLC